MRIHSFSTKSKTGKEEIPAPVVFVTQVRLITDAQRFGETRPAETVLLQFLCSDHKHRPDV